MTMIACVGAHYRIVLYLLTVPVYLILCLLLTGKRRIALCAQVYLLQD